MRESTGTTGSFLSQLPRWKETSSSTSTEFYCRNLPFENNFPTVFTQNPSEIKMSSQKFSSFSSLLPNSNILQPKRNNININPTPSPNLSDHVIGRRILGQKGQLPSLQSPNGISHLSTHQLTTLLRNSPILEASLGSLNGSNTIAAESPISGCSPCVTTTTSTGTKRAPNTMAKRNARERNRVKQVNQGFQTLRQHIPDSYRMKKMSKVDTLRCALDYIRNLERILQLPEDQGGASPLSILTSSPNHSTISPSTSLIFSSEDDELFVQDESPSSSFHHHNQSLLSANTSVDKICCNNTELEMDEPVFAPGLMTSGHRIIILSPMDSATMTSSTATYNNADNNDENSNQENQNLRIKLEPCSEELSSIKEETYGVHAIGLSVSSAENNRMVTDRILDVDIGMGIISPGDGQSQGHLSDGHSDIENYQENDAPKFQYS